MPPPLVRCALLATSILLAWGRSTAAANLSGYFLDEQEQGRVTVDTKLGPVTGLAFPGGVRGFLGIPYALPPIKTLRFEPPVPLTSWGGGRLDATEFGDNCMQSIPADSPPTRISEDCLFLNVWTPPGARKGSKLPVMIWLYGGGFQQGASSHPEYDGRRLAQKGVLVVSINYRLGALGWMVSVAENLWGNYGLQDQRLGMEWVHDNIVSFGGDPGRVTVFGESAGAMCIGQHLHSDKAGVLFQQAVMQSNPLGYRFRSVTVANFLGEAMKLKLDCHSLECLQSESAADVLRVQETLMGLPRSVGDFFTWGPVVPDRNYYRHVGENQKQFSYSSQEEEEEKEARDKKKKKTINLFGDPPAHPDDDDAGSSRKKKNADLTLVGPISYTAPSMKVVQPLQVMAAAASSATAARVARAGGGGGGDGRGGRAGGEDRGPLPIPVMLGVNAEEGVMFVHLAFPVTMPRLVYQSFVFALFRSSTLGVLHTYGAVADQCAESGDYRKVMSHIMHDYLFRCPNLRAAQLLQEKNGREAPVFVYEFTHPTEIDGLPACAGLACHTSELPYVFNNMDIIKTNYSYHEAGKPGATSFPPPVGLYAEDGGLGGEGGGGGGGGGGGPLSAVGNALGGVAGGVAGGVTGVVRSGFGIRRLFGRRGMSSPAEEVEGAIGGGAVGFAGKVVAAAVGSDDAGDISGEGEGEGGAGGGIGGGGAGSVLEDGAELGVGGAGEAGAGTSRNVGGAAASAAAADADGSQKGSHKDSREGSQKDAPASPKRGSATTRRGEDGTEGGGGGGANPSSQGASGDGDSDGIGSMTGERGLGGSNCAAAPARDTPGVGGASGSLRPRPTVAEAAEADALVGDAMVNYWASFGKAGDPNSANAPVLWPAWEGRQLTAQGRTSGALALDSVIAAGRGGVGKGSFSDDFAQAWLRAGADAMGGGGGGGGAGGSGSYFLEIRAHPRVKEAERDCLCEFWDRTKYKH